MYRSSDGGSTSYPSCSRHSACFIYKSYRAANSVALTGGGGSGQRSLADSLHCCMIEISFSPTPEAVKPPPGRLSKTPASPNSAKHSSMKSSRSSLVTAGRRLSLADARSSSAGVSVVAVHDKAVGPTRTITTTAVINGRRFNGAPPVRSALPCLGITGDRTQYAMALQRHCVARARHSVGGLPAGVDGPASALFRSGVGNRKGCSDEYIGEESTTRGKRMVSVAMTAETGVKAEVWEVLAADDELVPAFLSDADVVVAVGAVPDTSRPLVVVATDHASLVGGLRCAQAVTVEEQLHTLPVVVRAVAAGYRCLPAFSDLEKLLDPEEVELLMLLSAGATDDRIAAVIGYSRRQTQRRLRLVFSRLGVRSRRDAWRVLGGLRFGGRVGGGL
jgi:DNA-binding CsgD family transcriptional regulator